MRTPWPIDHPWACRPPTTHHAPRQHDHRHLRCSLERSCMPPRSTPPSRPRVSRATRQSSSNSSLSSGASQQKPLPNACTRHLHRGQQHLSISINFTCATIFSHVPQHQFTLCNRASMAPSHMRIALYIAMWPQAKVGPRLRHEGPFLWTRSCACPNPTAGCVGALSCRAAERSRCADS